MNRAGAEHGGVGLMLQSSVCERMTVLDEYRLEGASIIVTGDLVSDASSYTTGETVVVDGGYAVR